MKTFTTNFATEVSRKRGAQPLWMISVTVSGVTYYLSDVAATIAGWNGGVTTLPWISSWGEISEQMTGDMNEIRKATLSVTCIIDPDASPNISTLIAGDAENNICRLWLWYRNLNVATDPPVCFFTGHIYDLSGDAQTVQLTFEDETYRLNGTFGTVATIAQFPDIDPDDVGKLLPIVYGTVSKLPALAVDAVPTTMLTEYVSSATSFTVGSSAAFAVSDIVRVDNEEMQITNISGNEITVTRAVNSTMSTDHGQGAVIYRLQVYYHYLAAGHPVASIDKVYGLISGRYPIDITSLATVYTGQVGNQCPDYGNYAMVRLPDMARLATNAAEFNLVDNTTIRDLLEIFQGSHSHPSASVGTASLPLDTVVSESGWYTGNPASYMVDNNDSTAATSNGYPTSSGWASAVIRRAASFSNGYTPFYLRAKLLVNIASVDNWVGMANFDVYINGTYKGSITLSAGTGDRYLYTNWYAVTDWSDISNANTKIIMAVPIHAAGASGWSSIKSVSWEVDYGTVGTTLSVAAGVARSNQNLELVNDITLSGNSSANTRIADAILCDITGLYTTPGDVATDLLSHAGYGAASVVGTVPIGYAINGAITTQTRLIESLTRLAFQCRAFIRMMNGAGKLFIRPDTLTSSRTISAVAVDGGKPLLNWNRAPMSQVINEITLRYGRDWQNTSGEPYLLTSAATDSASVTKYGKQTRDSLFRCDFITGDTMADSVRAFYLALLAPRRTYYYATVYLDYLNVEFGDIVTLPDGKVGVVVSAGIQPGSADQIDRIKLTVMV